jgi:hypothetical protein
MIPQWAAPRRVEIAEHAQVEIADVAFAEPVDPLPQ